MIGSLAHMSFKIFDRILSLMRSSQAQKNSISLINKCRILNGDDHFYV